MSFRHFERCAPALRALLGQRRQIKRHAAAERIWNLHDWLLCPLTLWAIDYAGAAAQVARAFVAGEELDSDLQLLLKILPRPPSEFTQQAVGEYEKIVTKGLYDNLTKQPLKFSETEAKQAKDRELLTCWNQLKSRFPVQKKRNAGGVIRRTMSKERNFNPFVSFSWRKRDRFQILFDALCYRWCLYGFEGDKPLLLKVSVNPIPHGTMIVIPRHWSFDRSRDINWHELGRIHKVHGTARQGPAYSSGRIQREADRQQAKALRAEAVRRGLKGMAKSDFILTEMKQDLRRTSWLKRLLKD